MEIGWLRPDERQDYRVWHDRLLNWQIAEALADAIGRDQRDPAAFGQRCASDFYRLPASEEAQRLGYVLMDVIWLLAERGVPAAGHLDIILRPFENDFRAAEALYEHLLPTVGPAIAPAMFRRLEAAEQPAMQSGYIVSGLEKLDTAAVAPRATALLSSEDGRLRRNAMALLVRRPAAEALDKLWLRYVDLLPGDRLESENDRGSWWEERSLWAALKACVSCDPLWLEQTIRAMPAARGKSAGALASLLCAVPDGRPRWLRLKETLRQNMVGGGESDFATAVYHWRDESEAQWLRTQLASKDDLVGAFCLRALIRIAPEAALTSLGDVPPQDLSSTRKWPMNLLWVIRSEETVKRIRELMQERADAFWEYAQTLCDLPNALDEATFQLLLDALLPEMVTGSAEDWRSELSRVAEASRLLFLQCLRRRAGTAWEAGLTRLLVEEDPHLAGWRGPVQKDAKQVLYKTGGEGYTRLVNHWLTNGDLYARREGIAAAFKRPDAETVRLLEALAFEGHDGQGEDGSHYDAYIAQMALARSEAWRSVVSTIVRWQENSNREIIFARLGAGPLTDEDMEPALAALTKDVKHPGAIMALGFGQRTDYSAFIVSALGKEEPETYTAVANACLWALTMLPTVPSEAVEVLVRHLRGPEGRWLVVHLLGREGGDQAAQALLEFLRSQLDAPLIHPYSYSIADDAIAAAQFLLREQATRDAATSVCRQRILRDGEPDFIAQRLIQATLSESSESGDAEEKRTPVLLNDERTRNFLARSAFQDGEVIYEVGERARAIRGLAAFAPSDAYEAALRVLKSPHANDRDQSPRLLLEIDQERAVGDLLEHLAAERKTLLRRTCARALCAAGVTDDLRERCLTSSDTVLRGAACFALGFAAPSDAVEASVRACLTDDDVRVFEAACESLPRLDAAQCTEELVTAYLASQNTAERWILLDAALETGDVFDVTWLRRMLQNAQPLTVDYVQEEVEKRRKKEEYEADSEDRHNGIRD